MFDVNINTMYLMCEKQVMQFNIKLHKLPMLLLCTCQYNTFTCVRLCWCIGETKTTTASSHVQHNKLIFTPLLSVWFSPLQLLNVQYFC